jgi:predicted transcriptional regulator
VKEYVTMKEASVLLDRTTKTIKNYVKRGMIKNFFLVDGKYGQEYKISVRDLEPLGMVNLDVLRDDFVLDDARNLPEENGGISTELQSNGRRKATSDHSSESFIARYEQLVIDLDRARERISRLTEESTRLQQELEEKNMLIQVLMKKSKP